MSWDQAQHSVWERATKGGGISCQSAFSCSPPGADFSIFVVLLSGHSRCVRVCGGSTVCELDQLVSELSGVLEQLFYLTVSDVRLQEPGCLSLQVCRDSR